MNKLGSFLFYFTASFIVVLLVTFIVSAEDSLTENILRSIFMGLLIAIMLQVADIRKERKEGLFSNEAKEES